MDENNESGIIQTYESIYAENNFDTFYHIKYN